MIGASLAEILQHARENGHAIGHFNIANVEMLYGVVRGAKEAGVAAVMIGTSEGERESIGLRASVALVAAYASDEQITLLLNADHTKAVAKAKAAIDAGYPSVHFDGSAFTFEDNVAQTGQVVSYARRVAAIRKIPEISVEGELGYIGGGSEVTRERIVLTPGQMTDPEQAREFVERTGIDRLAIAIGNIHGLNLEEPALDFERLKAIREAVPESCALVLHAGSGISDEDVRKAIVLGIANIHISTELRKAWRDALARSLVEHPQEYAPYKIAAPAMTAVKEIVMQKLRLFSGNM